MSVYLKKVVSIFLSALLIITGEYGASASSVEKYDHQEKHMILQRIVAFLTKKLAPELLIWAN